jgi:hypothetical protein
MESNTIDFIEPTPSLHGFIVYNEIIKIISERIKHIPSYESLRLSLDLVLMIANMIENLCYENNINSKNQEKNFKREIAVNVYKFLGWISADDKLFLLNSIQFLWSSGRIKKLKLYKRIWCKVKNLVIKN